jgi:anthranilate phosphoribosyltransferase
VVHAADGLDEISTMGLTRVSELRDGRISTWVLDPADLGLRPANLAELQIGGVDDAASALLAVLDGEKGAKRDIAALNAAAALVIAGKAGDLGEGLGVADAAIDAGKARRTLDDLVRLTKL